MVRAKSLFHKSQIQILFEAISEYINRHYEYGSTILQAGVNVDAASWSAGIFDVAGASYQHPSPAARIIVEISGSDRQLLSRLEAIWGGALRRERPESGGDPSDNGLWTWELRAERARRFLGAILPYMKGAKRSAVKKSLAQLKDLAARQATEDASPSDMAGSQDG